MLTTNEKAKKMVYGDLYPGPLDLWAAAIPTALISSRLAFLLVVVFLFAVALPITVALPLAEAVAKISFRCQQLRNFF